MLASTSKSRLFCPFRLYNRPSYVLLLHNIWLNVYFIKNSIWRISKVANQSDVWRLVSPSIKFNHCGLSSEMRRKNSCVCWMNKKYQLKIIISFDGASSKTVHNLSTHIQKNKISETCCPCRDRLAHNNKITYWYFKWPYDVCMRMSVHVCVKYNPIKS